jgi:hypothetical protein
MDRALVAALSMAVLLHNVALGQVGDLHNQLEVRQVQSGIAGETGTQWLIKPDGAWSAQRVQSGTVPETYASGVLKPQELSRLREMLNEARIEKLPPKIGSPTRANPQTLTIRWGDHVTVLISPPGVDPTNQLHTAGSPEQRAANIAREVQKLTTK